MADMLAQADVAHPLGTLRPAAATMAVIVPADGGVFHAEPSRRPEPGQTQER